MAQIENNHTPRKKKRPFPLKRKSTQIDMTAMVDVAFLLLTFFVLTATMVNTSIMELAIPPKGNDKDTHIPISERKIMTLILAENNQIYFYKGITLPETGNASFDMENENSLRSIIQQHLIGEGTLPPCSKGASKKTECWDPIFVVKPKGNSTYKNLIDVLDEFAINGARKYAIDRYTIQDSLVML